MVVNNLLIIQIIKNPYPQGPNCWGGTFFEAAWLPHHRDIMVERCPISTAAIWFSGVYCTWKILASWMLYPFVFMACRDNYIYMCH
jgi:hypothetical protein